jgi:hypothetical protein
MKKISSAIMALAMFTIMSVPAQAQSLRGLGNKIKKAAQETVNDAVGTKSPGNPAGSASLGGLKSTIGAGKSFYVNGTTGSARGDGSKASPLKDIQKAIDMASDGDVVRISEGNYLGTLERGWIEIKNKYVSLEGGWNGDFSERNPLKYVTRMQPGIANKSTIGSFILNVEATSDENRSIVIDGIFFDLGLAMEYMPAVDDPRNGWPEGCETGRIKPVATPPNPTIRLIGGKVAGNLTIRNCMFLNASFNGIIMSNMGGNWEICNNVFVSNLYAACEITGGLNQNTSAHQSKVNFHNNTVLFSWPTTKEMESMGYGYRFRNGADHDVHHNIFGCNNFGALDAGWDDSNLPAANRKILSAHDNMFFMNKGDLVMAGSSGGSWLYVPAKRFDEVEKLTKYENNIEMPSDCNLKDLIDPPYLKGYATLEVISTESYDPNSAANTVREAFGLNKQGTSTTRVTMLGNRYNFDKAMQLFGAVEGYGAQMPATEK